MTTKSDNNVDQSKKDGTVTTNEGKKVEATSPAIPAGAEDKAINDEKAEKNAIIVEEEDIKSYYGELEAGDKGWIPLEEDGRLAGPAKKGRPPENQPFVEVYRHGPPHGEVTTMSGAPLMKIMNPTIIKKEDEPATREPRDDTSSKK